MRISDWSSDVCSSDLFADADTAQLLAQRVPLEHAFESQEVRHGGRELDVRCRADHAAVPDVRREAHVKRLRKRGDMPAFRDADRKSVVWGKSVSGRVDLGGRRIMKKKKLNKIS